MNYELMALGIFEKHIKGKQKMIAKSFNGMPGETGILDLLCFDKDGSTAGEISTRLGVSTGRIAVILNNLVKKGLVIRKIDSLDKRVVKVFITGDGKTFINNIRDHAILNITKLLSYLGDEDASEFVRILDRISMMEEEI